MHTKRTKIRVWTCQALISFLPFLPMRAGICVPWVFAFGKGRRRSSRTQSSKRLRLQRGTNMHNVEMSNSLRNLFSHIQNGCDARVASIEVNKTKTVVAVLNVLQQNGYTRGYRFNIQKPRKIEILLKYKNQEPAILRPPAASTASSSSGSYHIPPRSRRTYLVAKAISALIVSKRITLIISTSKGIISGINAHKLNLGGELICMAARP